MSKGLETLNYLRECVGNKYYKEELDAIEKYLIVLDEIVGLIKIMGYDLDNLGGACFRFSIDCSASISEHTFNMLKEIFDE